MKHTQNRSRGAHVPAQEAPPLRRSSSFLGVVIVWDFPEPFTVADPPTGLQQDLGLRIHIQDALLALGLRKKGKRGVCSCVHRKVSSPQ
jgi:hypothetical protein